MFDYIRCLVPLPVGKQTAAKLKMSPFQTLDTPEQAFNVYTIKPDGMLWRRSDGASEAVRSVFSGTIRFRSANYEFSARFLDGQLLRDSLVRH